MREMGECDWNPFKERPSYVGDDPGACQKPAVWLVGEYHLCSEHADLPQFKRKFRKPLNR
jgi:hypothetical protein